MVKGSMEGKTVAVGRDHAGTNKGRSQGCVMNGCEEFSSSDPWLCFSHL